MVGCWTINCNNVGENGTSKVAYHRNIFNFKSRNLCSENVEIPIIFTLCKNVDCKRLVEFFKNVKGQFICCLQFSQKTNVIKKSNKKVVQERKNQIFQLVSALPLVSWKIWRHQKDILVVINISSLERDCHTLQ